MVTKILQYCALKIIENTYIIYFVVVVQNPLDKSKDTVVSYE